MNALTSDKAMVNACRSMLESGRSDERSLLELGYDLQDIRAAQRLIDREEELRRRDPRMHHRMQTLRYLKTR